MFALFLAAILSDQAIVDYAKKLDVSQLDSSIQSQSLERWLSDRFDDVQWRADCALKDPQEPVPLCVQIFMARRDVNGQLMLRVGDADAGLSGPVLRYALVRSHKPPMGPIRETAKLSDIPGLFAQIEQESTHAAPPRIDDLPDWGKPEANDVDLDADGKFEHVEIVDLGGVDRHRYQLRVGEATIEGEFFAAEEDKPRIRFVRIDGWLEGNGRQQVEVMTTGPSDCRYEFFDYREGRFIRLGALTSDRCAYEPVLLGACRIRMSSWHGFWEQRDLYELTPEPSLTRVPQRYYDVDVQGRWKKSGEPADVLAYDSVEKTYLVRDASGIVKIVREEDSVDALDVEWAN